MTDPAAVGAVADGRAMRHATVSALNGARSTNATRFKQQVHEALLEQVDLVSASVAHTDAAKLAELRAKVDKHHLRPHGGARRSTGSAEELAGLRQEIVDEALGLGPLEDLMNDEEVTEIMVNGPDTIYVERHGSIEPTTKRFTDDAPAALDHRAHHHAARPAHRRIVADGRRAPARRLARQRDHRAGRDRRRDADDSPLRHRRV